VKRAKLGEVELDVVEVETPEHPNEVTIHPVEKGSEIIDHVKQNAISFSINGTVSGENAPQKLSQLRQYRDNGELLTYIGRNAFRDMVIESLSTRHDASIRNGFRFSITLKQVRIAKSLTVEIQLPDPVSPKPIGTPATTTQTKNVTNKGTQQKQKVNIDEEKKAVIESGYDVEVQRLKVAQRQKSVQVANRLDGRLGLL
jgi:hypothetical protein